MSLINIIAPLDNQEGTTMLLQSWMKEIGSSIKVNEALVELETDKVTMEVEAPANGILKEILVEIGMEIEPGTVLGRLSTEVEVATTKTTDSITSAKHLIDEIAPQARKCSSEDNKEFSPSVRRFLNANDLDASQIIGSGKKGRITLENAKQYLVSTTVKATEVVEKVTNKAITETLSVGASERIGHTGMRRSIAKHMSESVTVAPHVTAVFEADFSAISVHRAANKSIFSKQGVKLTYTAYIVMACVEAMKAVPEVNSQWHDDSIEVFSDINIGVGASLGDKGLIVPVIPKAQEMNLLGIAKHLQGSIDRARENKLKPEDVRGGTFTISNHGVSGSLLATPIIINQPQSAILGVGKLEKRVVVKSLDGQDTMSIRPMAYVSLTIDHRVLDGHQTNIWLSAFVDTLENWRI